MHHQGNPVLRHQMETVTMAIDDNENKKPSKRKSTDRIDGVMALVMALGTAVQAEVITPFWE